MNKKPTLLLLTITLSILLTACEKSQEDTQADIKAKNDVAQLFDPKTAPKVTIAQEANAQSNTSDQTPFNQVPSSNP